MLITKNILLLTTIFSRNWRNKYRNKHACYDTSLRFVNKVTLFILANSTTRSFG